jgi:hypothetical protein
LSRYRSFFSWWDRAGGVWWRRTSARRAWGGRHLSAQQASAMHLA